MARKRYRKKKRDKSWDIVLPDVNIELVDMVTDNRDRQYKVSGLGLSFLLNDIKKRDGHKVIEDMDYGTNIILRSPTSMVIDDKDSACYLMLALLEYVEERLSEYAGIREGGKIVANHFNIEKCEHYRVLAYKAAMTLIPILRDYVNGLYEMILFSDILDSDEVL